MNWTDDIPPEDKDRMLTMTERVRVFQVYAETARMLSAKLQWIEAKGFETKLTMGMFGPLGDFNFWIICREKPDRERIDSDTLAAFERALSKHPR